MRAAAHDLTPRLLLLSVTLLSGGLWLIGFFLSRVYLFQSEYNSLRQRRENDLWLLRQCEHDEFYHNMKHHSELCDHLASERRDSLFLLALHRVAMETYLCGYEPCHVLIDGALTWALGRGLVVSCLAVVMLVFMPMLVYPHARAYYFRARRAQARHALHDPYNRLQYETLGCDDLQEKYPGLKCAAGAVF